MPDEKILKIENVKEQKRISSEIQELIKNYKESDLTFFILHPETNTITIPFLKKNESDLPKLKMTYFNTLSKKNEDFLMYDFVGHLKKFGFEWNHNALGFKFEIKIDGKKIKKKIFYQKIQERKSLLINRDYGICNQLGNLIILLTITAEYRF